MKIAREGFPVIVAVLLGACGGGAGTTPISGTEPVVQCDPADSTTLAECGSVMITLTDADGDFLGYTVDVVSLTLETANGRLVETLPRHTRINFADYVDLSELVTVATVPPATYVAGTIRLDYAAAEIFVEAGGAAKEAVVTDASATPLARTELRIVLSNRDRLVVRKGLPALLQLDFDLDASHAVNIVPTPATAVAEPFILAEISPVDEKRIRVRGPLVSVDDREMTYTVAIRPFHDRDGDFGQATITVTADTEFEIDDTFYVGAEGLRALDAAGIRTPTVAAGTLDVAARRFTADLVLAGSSVPGVEFDAVIGNVIARDGSFLTVRGATIIPADRNAYFHDDVVVEIGPQTRVFRDGHRFGDLGIDAISVGQRITVRGKQSAATTDLDAPLAWFDATQGAVRMHVTHLLGIVNTITPGQTDVALHAIDRRRVGIFDFSGTGPSAELDADPANYEVATGNLTMSAFSEGKPVVARGFPNSFGAAPPDFIGRTVIDYTDVRSILGIGWGTDGTTAPFSSLGVDGLVIDNTNADIGLRHHVNQGPILIDLTTLDSSTTIVPRGTGRTAFYVKTPAGLMIYPDFDGFVADLASRLDGATTARSMHARGRYDADTNVFTAYRIGIYLLEP